MAVVGRCCGVGLIAVLAVACAQSERKPAGDWAASCFERRELEAWDERFGLECVREDDDGADGRIDLRTDNVFDEQGHHVAAMFSSGPIAERRWTYDDEDNVVTSEAYDSDGELASRTEVLFDEEGKRTSEESDHDGDGELDLVAIYEYESCASEEVFPSVWLACSISYDVDNDGDIDGVTATVRDEQDGTERTVTYNPLTGETVALRIVPSGHTTNIEEDFGDDGTVDRISGSDYDDDGQFLRSWVDSDGDGTKDEWTEHTGSPLTGHTLETTYDREGVVREVEGEYDEDGQVLRATFRFLREPEEDYAVEYRADGAGNPVATARDEYPLGSADECQYFSYACWVE